jgi:plasmid stability protein
MMGMDMKRETGIELLVRVANGDRVTPEEARRLLTAAAESSNHTQALGLDRLSRIRYRDAALVEAAHVLAADCTSPWIVAGRLARAVNRFQTRIWPRLRAGGHAGSMDPLDSALHRAFMAGERVPATARRLFDLVK